MSIFKLKDLLGESEGRKYDFTKYNELVDRIIDQGTEVYLLDEEDKDQLENSMGSFWDPEEEVFTNYVDEFYDEFNSNLKDIWSRKAGPGKILLVPTSYYIYEIPFFSYVGDDYLYYVDDTGLDILYDFTEEDLEELFDIISDDIVNEGLNFNEPDFENLIDYIADNNLNAVDISNKSLYKIADVAEDFWDPEKGMYDVDATKGSMWEYLEDAFVESSIEDIEGTNNKIILFYSNDYIDVEPFVGNIGEDTLWTYDNLRGFNIHNPVSYEQWEAIKEVGGMLDESITENKTWDDYIDFIVDNDLTYIPLPDNVYMPQQVPGYLEKKAIDKNIDPTKTFTIITPTTEKGYDVYGNKADWFYLAFQNSDLIRINGDVDLIQNFIDAGSGYLNEVDSEYVEKYSDIIDKIVDGDYQFNPVGVDYPSWHAATVISHLEQDKISSGVRQFTYVKYKYENSKDTGVYPYLFHFDDETTITVNLSDEDLEEIMNSSEGLMQEKTLYEITYDSTDSIVDKIVEEGWVYIPWPSPGGYPISKSNMAKKIRVETTSERKRVYSAVIMEYKNAADTEKNTEIEILWSSLKRDSKSGPEYVHLEVDYIENPTQEDFQDIIDAGDSLNEGKLENINESEYTNFDTLLDKVVDEGWVSLSIGGGVDKWSLDEINNYLSWRGEKDGKKYFYMRIGDTDGVFFFPNERPVFVDDLTDDDLRELVSVTRLREGVEKKPQDTYVNQIGESDNPVGFSNMIDKLVDGNYEIVRHIKSHRDLDVLSKKYNKNLYHVSTWQTEDSKNVSIRLSNEKDRYEFYDITDEELDDLIGIGEGGVITEDWKSLDSFLRDIDNTYPNGDFPLDIFLDYLLENNYHYLELEDELDSFDFNDTRVADAELFIIMELLRLHYTKKGENVVYIGMGDEYIFMNEGGGPTDTVFILDSINNHVKYDIKDELPKASEVGGLVDKVDLTEGVEGAEYNKWSDFREAMMEQHPDEDYTLDPIIDFFIENDYHYIDLDSKLDDAALGKTSSIKTLNQYEEEDIIEHYMSEHFEKNKQNIVYLGRYDAYLFVTEGSGFTDMLYVGVNNDPLKYELKNILPPASKEPINEDVSDPANIKIARLVDDIIDRDLKYYELSSSDMDRLVGMADRIKNEEGVTEDDLEKVVISILKKQYEKTGNRYYTVIHPAEIFGEVDNTSYRIQFYAKPNQYVYLDEYLLNYLYDSDYADIEELINVGKNNLLNESVEFTRVDGIDDIFEELLRLDDYEYVDVDSIPFNLAMNTENFKEYIKEISEERGVPVVTFVTTSIRVLMASSEFSDFLTYISDNPQQDKQDLIDFISRDKSENINENKESLLLEFGRFKEIDSIDDIFDQLSTKEYLNIQPWDIPMSINRTRAYKEYLSEISDEAESEVFVVHELFNGLFVVFSDVDKIFHLKEYTRHDAQDIIDYSKGIIRENESGDLYKLFEDTINEISNKVQEYYPAITPTSIAPNNYETGPGMIFSIGGENFMNESFVETLPPFIRSEIKNIVDSSFMQEGSFETALDSFLEDYPEIEKEFTGLEDLIDPETLRDAGYDKEASFLQNYIEDEIKARLEDTFTLYLTITTEFIPDTDRIYFSSIWGLEEFNYDKMLAESEYAINERGLTKDEIIEKLEEFKNNSFKAITTGEGAKNSTYDEIHTAQEENQTTKTALKESKEFEELLDNVVDWDMKMYIPSDNTYEYLEDILSDEPAEDWMSTVYEYLSTLLEKQENKAGIDPDDESGYFILVNMRDAFPETFGEVSSKNTYLYVHTMGIETIRLTDQQFNDIYNVVDVINVKGSIKEEEEGEDSLDMLKARINEFAEEQVSDILEEVAGYQGIDHYDLSFDDASEENLIKHSTDVYTNGYFFNLNGGELPTKEANNKFQDDIADSRDQALENVAHYDLEKIDKDIAIEFTGLEDLIDYEFLNEMADLAELEGDKERSEKFRSAAEEFIEMVDQYVTEDETLDLYFEISITVDFDVERGTIYTTLRGAVVGQYKTHDAKEFKFTTDDEIDFEDYKDEFNSARFDLEAWFAGRGKVESISEQEEEDYMPELDDLEESLYESINDIFNDIDQYFNFQEQPDIAGEGNRPGKILYADSKVVGRNYSSLLDMEDWTDSNLRKEIKDKIDSTYKDASEYAVKYADEAVEKYYPDVYYDLEGVIDLDQMIANSKEHKREGDDYMAEQYDGAAYLWEDAFYENIREQGTDINIYVEALYYNPDNSEALLRQSTIEFRTQLYIDGITYSFEDAGAFNSKEEMEYVLKEVTENIKKWYAEEGVIETIKEVEDSKLNDATKYIQNLIDSNARQLTKSSSVYSDLLIGDDIKADKFINDKPVLARYHVSNEYLTDLMKYLNGDYELPTEIRKAADYADDYLWEYAEKGLIEDSENGEIYLDDEDLNKQYLEFTGMYDYFILNIDEMRDAGYEDLADEIKDTLSSRAADLRDDSGVSNSVNVNFMDDSIIFDMEIIIDPEHLSIDAVKQIIIGYDNFKEDSDKAIEDLKRWSNGES